MMVGSVQETYEIELPKNVVSFVGSSAYAKSVTLAHMGHLTWVLENITGQNSAPVCFDIGANIGLTTLLMEQCFTGGQIFSFEPHPKTFGQLEHNILANQTGENKIRTFPLGLGKAKGELMFRDIDQYNTGNSILLKGSLAAQAQKGTKIPVDRLDDLNLLPAGQSVDLMKIDVEGFELDVLKGAPETLKNTKIVLVEFNHWCLTSLARTFPEDALEFFFDHFDAVYVYNTAAKGYRRIVTPADKWGFLHGNMVNFNVNDLLCTSDETVIEQLERSS